MYLTVTASDTVRRALKATIHQIGMQLPVEAFSAIDEHHRRFDWTRGADLFNLPPQSVKLLPLNSDADRFFVGLLASHHNGFVRAEAIGRVATDPTDFLLPFVLMRLTDWVDEVRVAAEQALLFRIRQAKSGRPFVDCLALLDRLARSTRFRPEYSTLIDDLLTASQCAEDLQRGIALPSQRIRRRCFRLAARNPEFDRSALILQAIKDSDVEIRKWAYTDANADLLRDHAANDPFAPIRRLAFNSLQGEAQALLPFLLDRSKPIRQECQRILRDRFNVSPTEFYRTRLRSNEISLLGLAEIGLNQDDRAAIAALLDNDASSKRIRRVAIQALRIAGGEQEADALFRLIATDCSSVAHEAATTLLAGRMLPADTIWTAACSNPEPLLRARILKLLRFCCKWMQVRLYLAAVVDADAVVSKRGLAQLSQWSSRFNKSFTQPTAQDKQAILSLLQTANRHLSEETIRHLKFLIQ